MPQHRYVPGTWTFCTLGTWLKTTNTCYLEHSKTEQRKEVRKGIKKETTVERGQACIDSMRWGNGGGQNI